MSILITGGAGFIGSTLAHNLVERGEEVVLFIRTLRKERIGDILDKVKIVRGDVGILAHVLNAVKTYNVKTIYHTGAMLATESDNNPWGSFQTNIVGFYNVMEAARLLDVERVMFASSIATFGMGVGIDIYDDTSQRPHDMYALSKLFGENYGKFYRNRFGIDFRSVRYPTITGPGVMTPGHWDVEMIECALKGIPYECPYSPEAKVPLMWYKDAARVAELLLQTPKENIKTVNYNVAGIPGMVSTTQLAEAVRKYVPGARITFSTNPLPLAFHSYFNVWDDGCARKELGWQPELTTLEQFISAFKDELKARQ
jgi:threonine 3-dehydrogenase